MTKDIVDILTALLTPLLAVIATLIAIFQWRLEKQKWRLALYEKRFETYKAVTSFLSLLVMQGSCEHSDEATFLREASRHQFLFDRDIQEYIELIYKKSVDRNALNATIQNTHGNDMTDFRMTLAEQTKDISLWFSDQFDVAKIKFGEYISITKR